MRTGTGILLITVGASLRFALAAGSPHGLNVHIVGVILMVAGVAGLLLPRLAASLPLHRDRPGDRPRPRRYRAAACGRHTPAAACRKVLRAAVPAALAAVAFGFALPHVESYHSVWASMVAMTWPQALLVAAVAAASMVSYWIMICSVLPALRLREAAAVNLSSSAVASTLPAGGALAMGSAGR
jgi:hypothetical protein